MQNILQSPVIYLSRKMYFYAFDRRKKIILATTMFVLANIADAVQPLIFGYFLDFIQKNGVSRGNLPNLFFTLLLFLLAELIFWVFWGPARLIEQETAFLTRKNYKEYLLKGVMALPLGWHADRHSGNTIDKIEKGSNAIFSFSEGSFMFIQAFVRLAIAVGVLIYFSFYASLGVMVVCFLTFYIMFLYDKKLIPGYRAVNRLENSISAKVYDVISNITTVIILRVESLVFKSLGQAIDSPFPQFKKNILNSELKWFWAASLGQLSVILAIGIYLFGSISAGEIILVGSIFILYSYAAKVKETFFSFAHLYNDSVRWRSNIANAEEISKDFADLELSKSKRLPADWSMLSIKNLSFSYHDQEGADLHLDNVNVDLKKGEKIALIGESGGGKTTFLKLLRGLYPHKTLTLEVDRQRIGGDFNLISDSISLIPQDPEIFSTTIRENITLGIEYGDGEVKTYTDLAAFSDVVDRLPNRLDSSIVEKGVNLSGGEKQRLALARGLLASRDKDIMLLDEPTSSVDFHNELEIYENIFSSMPEKTIISSVHRLHLLPLFDNIFFFKEGKIIARGNLKELKEKSPDFDKLWTKYLESHETEREI